jgi:predicted TIM-barrel fold metal-dependent hydrolase
LLTAWQTDQAVDHHCHPLRRWPFELTALDLRAAFTEALDPRLAQEHVPQTVAYRDALHRLTAILHCDPTEEAVVEMHNRDDPAAYANRLLDASGDGVLLLDHGFSRNAFSSEEHRAAIHLPQRHIIRLETLAESLIPKFEHHDDWINAVLTHLRQAVKEGAVGVKTIAAYRAGLHLTRVDDGDVAEAFTTIRAKVERAEAIRLSGVPLVHTLLFDAAAVCRDQDVPLQVHCGFGDPDEDLALCSPLGLRPLIQDDTYRGLRIALLHCYPYHLEAAYLCSVYPDVYMDLSLAIPMAGLDGVRAMREALGLCPWSKLLYATDATRLPEVYYVAARAQREALAAALADLVDAAVLSISEAVAAGREVLSGNSSRVYRLA